MIGWIRTACRLASPAAVGIFMSLAPALANTTLIPQVADGGGWSTTIVLSNRTASAQTVTLRFYRAVDANGATASWTPAFRENVTLPTLTLAAGSSLFLHTRGEGALSQGWGELTAPAGVTGYAIFSAQGQDATAPATSPASRFLLPFDNTSDLVTSVAIANPNEGAVTVRVRIRTADGAVTSTQLPQIPAKGHRAFELIRLLPDIRGQRGLAELWVESGSFSVIALRFNPTFAFTTSPVYPQSGPPILGESATLPPNRAPRKQVIAQVADGGSWSTTLVLTNTSRSTLPASLTFRSSIPGGQGATVSWNPPLREDFPTSNFNIPGGSTIFLQTTGTAQEVSQGFAELTADESIEAYAIFTQRVQGKMQDGTATAVTPTGRLLVPFDNTTGLVTAMAIVNPGESAASISVNLRTASGTISKSAAIDLPARGHIAVVMPTLFPEIAGTRGLAEFYAPSGTIAFLALRFSDRGAFASAPAYFESGAPILSGSGSGGGESSGMSPTPAEIESWAARGYYSSGILLLTRMTSYEVNPLSGGSSPTMTKTDSFTAEFARFEGADVGKALRGELPPGFPNLQPAPGSCVVYRITSLTQPYPNLTKSGLDAGPQLTSRGPNGVRQAPRKGAQPQAGMLYESVDMPNTYLVAGRYTLEGPGGAQVGPFSGTLEIGQEFVVTTNPADLNVIERSNGLTIRWSGGDPSLMVSITGTSVSSPTDGAVFVCIENNSAGQFTVPASVLTQLPASPSLSAGGFSLITRGSLTVTATGRGVRFSTPTGLDILTANNSWIWSYTPQYR